MPALSANKELFQIAGDEQHGISSTMDLTRTALGHPMIEYGSDRVIEADVYAMKGHLMVHLICPRCRHALTIRADQKHMEYSIRSNELSVEAFRCTWEMDDWRREFGMSMCGWTVAVDKNVARDA
jgi:uncharacterized protein YbaR (Trm112 family)